MKRVGGHLTGVGTVAGDGADNGVCAGPPSAVATISSTTSGERHGGAGGWRRGGIAGR